MTKEPLTIEFILFLIFSVSDKKNDNCKKYVSINDIRLILTEISKANSVGESPTFIFNVGIIDLFRYLDNDLQPFELKEDCIYDKNESLRELEFSCIKNIFIQYNNNELFNMLEKVVKKAIKSSN